MAETSKKQTDPGQHFTDKERFNRRFSQLKQERLDWEPHWKTLADHFAPRRQRFLATESNDGPKYNNKTLNEEPYLASRTIASGMMAGITSPARPWFQLGVPDPKLKDNMKVKRWLHEVRERMLAHFNRSNLYHMLPDVYKDLSVYGQAPMFDRDDGTGESHYAVFPIGSYWIQNDQKGRVRVFGYEYERTVEQVVNEFGYENCSLQTRTNWDNGDLSNKVTLRWLVEPNYRKKAKGSIKSADRMPWLSTHMEGGGSASHYNDQSSGATAGETILRQSGFEEFPIHCPRWGTVGEDTYGTDCPGMMALGSTRGLQLEERRKLEMIDKGSNPPIQAPSTMSGKKASLLPGGVTHYDMTQGGAAPVRPVYEPNPGWLNYLQDDINRVEARINRAFFVDLFLMLSQSDRRQITAREIEERHEEKLLMLGPVLERLHQELLDPLIDRTFNKMLRAGQLPEPPEEMEGVDLRVEYISVLAQAQKMVGTSVIDRFTAYIGNIAQMSPEALDKINIDEAIDAYAEMMGVEPDIVRSSEEVAALRQERQQAMQQQQQMEQAQQMAETAKTASETEVQGNSALDRIVSGL